MSLRLSLFAIATLIAASSLPLQAQPEAPPAKRVPAPAKAPLINTEAKGIVEAMIANYKALQSYSDKTEVTIDSGGLPKQLLDMFPVEATLAWQRPANLRFEGTAGGKKFLALSDAQVVRALSPQHPALFLEKNSKAGTITTTEDGIEVSRPERLNRAVYYTNAVSFGLAFMSEGDEFWGRTVKDVTVLALEPDADLEGVTCRVINVQAEGDDGSSSLIRLWIGRDDKLIRHLELANNGGGISSKIIETHSDIHINPELPASTWAFEPPTGLKKVEEFPYEDTTNRDLTVQIGSPLPAFTGTDINEQPIKLSPQDHQATVLFFFEISNGLYDVDALQRLQAALGDKGLRIIGVSGDGRRDRVEKFVRDHKLTFPVYFDEGAMNNRMAGVFGVRGWSTSLIFDHQGKLAALGGSTNSYDFMEALTKLFPNDKVDSLILNDPSVPRFRPAPPQ